MRGTTLKSRILRPIRNGDMVLIQVPGSGAPEVIVAFSEPGTLGHQALMEYGNRHRLRDGRHLLDTYPPTCLSYVESPTLAHVVIYLTHDDPAPDKHYTETIRCLDATGEGIGAGDVPSVVLTGPIEPIRAAGARVPALEAEVAALRESVLNASFLLRAYDLDRMQDLAFADGVALESAVSRWFCAAGLEWPADDNAIDFLHAYSTGESEENQ